MASEARLPLLLGTEQAVADELERLGADTLVTPAGTDLSALGAASFDLVLAVDSFPYVVQAGPAVADRHLADAARALRPGGAFAILNLSYRGDAGADRADAARWAAAGGWALAVDGAAPFALWDGTAFLLRRP